MPDESRTHDRRFVRLGAHGAARCAALGCLLALAEATMGRMLVVMSGLPGTGKSAIADALGSELGAPVLSVDPIEAAIWRCGISPSFETGVAAYEVAAVLAEHQLSLGLTAIVDSVSALEVARDVWRQAASRGGAELQVIEVV